MPVANLNIICFDMILIKPLSWKLMVLINISFCLILTLGFARWSYDDEFDIAAILSLVATEWKKFTFMIIYGMIGLKAFSMII